MPKYIERTQAILSRIALTTFVVGLLLAVLGVGLVYLGASGDTEFSFFGQNFKSTNVGIAAIFLGAALIVLNIRRTLTSLDRTVQTEAALQNGIKAEGKLRISDILVHQDEEAKTCLLDFRVHNTGGSDVLINRLVFEVLDVETIPTWGFMEFSKTYDLDISQLERKGDTIECVISQRVGPGETDRFGIILIAREMGTGVFRQWRLRPTLCTNFGTVSGKPVEVWLPHALP